MPDSRQLDILKRLTAHLEGVTPDNGYDFDLSASVFRGRLVYGEDDPATLVSIVEHLSGDVAVVPVGEHGVDRTETWVLLVQGWLKITGEHPTDDAYQLKASVEKRLSECVLLDKYGDPVFPDAYLLGRTVATMTIGPGVVSVQLRAEAGNRAFFYLPVGLSLAVDVSDPFLPE